MKQKIIYVSALLAIFFTGMLSMSVNNVKADGTGSCPCGNGKGFWTCANCNSFTEQPTTKTIGEWCKHYDWTDVTVCGHFNGFGYHKQPQVTQTAYFRDNCFWSFPVQCHSL